MNTPNKSIVEEPTRRIGLNTLAIRIQQRNPSWSKERCLAEAKALWTEEQIKDTPK